MAYKGEYDTIIVIGAVVGGIYLLQKSNFFGEIGQGIGDIGSGVGDIGSGLGSGLSGLGQGLGGGLYNIGEGIDYLGQGLGSGVAQIGGGVGAIGYGLGDTFSGLGNFESMLGQGLSNLLTGVGSFGGTFTDRWGDTLKFGLNTNNQSGLGNNAFPFTNSTYTPPAGTAPYQFPVSTMTKITNTVQYYGNASQKAAIATAAKQTPYAKAMAISPSAGQYFKGGVVPSKLIPKGFT